MNTTQKRTLPASGAVLLLAAIPAATWAAPIKLPPTTPTGITLVEVVREAGGGQPVFLWYRPGDAQGHTLFESDRDRPGISNCRDACAQEFRPFAASSGAKAFGDWSIVRGAEGVHQWAYQSHPLYVWSKEKIAGQVATNVGVSEDHASIPDISPNLGGGPPKEPPLMPPEGWQVARFTPAASLKLPDGIDARVVPSALAVALTLSNGMTLYTFDGDARRDGQNCTESACNLAWLPVTAPTIAMPVGDFSIVTRLDGARQWTYHNRPLYSYAGDKLPGDVHGAGIDKRWDVAALSADFRPRDVGLASLDGYGDVIALHGMTLYGGYPFEHRIGGRNQRDDFTHNSYLIGKMLGSDACADAQCASHWRPFAAPADAQADGWWEPIARADGSKQWAYKGYALYTNAGDRRPGDHSGQAEYDFVDPNGTQSNFQRTMFFIDMTHVKAGAGIYWNIAKP